jgi:hypothetical protein
MELCYVLNMDTVVEVPHPLPAPLAEVIAERFRLLGEPMRIRLLDALRAVPYTGQGHRADPNGSLQDENEG